MKVKHAISVLKKCNPEARLRMHDRFGEEVLFVCSGATETKDVWLESRDDIDIGAELEAQFKHAKESIDIDELDFYMTLLDIGFTISDIEKYMDSETAKHSRKFMEEHGLIRS